MCTYDMRVYYYKVQCEQKYWMESQMINEGQSANLQINDSIIKLWVHNICTVKKHTVPAHTNKHIQVIIIITSVLESALLDVQIQQWGTEGPQLMLLKWV